MTIVCIPGFGANQLIFTPQKEHFADKLIVPDFIQPQKQESLESYCKRWAVEIKKQVQEPFVLLGMSLGGMCAQELSTHLPCKAVILSGSLQKKLNFNIIHRVLEKISRYFPDGAIKSFRNLSPYWIALTEGLDKKQFKLIQKMVSQGKVSFYRWQAQAGAKWIQHGFVGRYSCPVYAAHGSKDLVVFMQKKTHDYDLIFKDGKHLINVTHADEMNVFIEDCIKKVS